MSSESKDRQMLISDLSNAINSCKRKFIWIGISKKHKAVKYKYELLWFSNHIHHDSEDSLEDQIKHSDNRICTSKKEAYAHAFEAINNTFRQDGVLKVFITDLTISYTDDYKV